MSRSNYQSDGRSNDQLDGPSHNQSDAETDIQSNGQAGGQSNGESDNQSKVRKIERITNRRWKNGKMEYLIKWEGYDSDDNTWENENDSISPELLAEFEEYLKQVLLMAKIRQMTTEDSTTDTSTEESTSNFESSSSSEESPPNKKTKTTSKCTIYKKKPKPRGRRGRKY